MRPFTARATTVKWYHVIWATHRRRRVFKIPALRRFCEQVIRVNCVHADWIVDRVCVKPDRVHLLVKASGGVPRERLVQALKDAAGRVVREAGVVNASRTMWNEGCWCAAVSSAPGVEAVRRYLAQASSQGPTRESPRESLIRQVAETTRR